MIKKKRRISYFPNTFFVINKKTYRAMNTKLSNIYKDFNFFLSMDKGKFTDRLRIQNKNFFKDFSGLNENEIKDKKKKLLRNKSDSFFLNITNKLNENKTSLINNITPKKEKKICYPKISIIKDLKLTFSKKDINNNPKTSRYFNYDVLQKDIHNKNNYSLLKKESYNVESFLNNENKNTTTRKNNLDIKKIKKIKILDDSKKTKNIFFKKCKKLMEEIISIEKESEKEKEKEKELSEKEKDLIDMKLKSLHNSMILKSNLPIDEKLEIHCREKACSYQKRMGLFYNEKCKKGLYTSHFFTVLKKDKFFPHYIIQKLSNYYLK